MSSFVQYCNATDIAPRSAYGGYVTVSYDVRITQAALTVRRGMVAQVKSMEGP